MQPACHPRSDPQVNTQRARHPLLFRGAAILLGLSLLVLLEIALRLCGVQPLPDSQDPYISFSSDATLFIKDPAGTSYQTAPERIDFFRPQAFPVKKPADTFRVFVLGGSTVQGRPYAVETSFTTWLKINLQAAEPERDMEVINCGGVSYASYRLVPILRETLQYQPDLFIVYTGHNEFLEERSYGNFKQSSPIYLTAQKSLRDLRIASLLQRILPDTQSKISAAPKTVLTADVNARLDFQKGLEGYHRDLDHRRDIVNHFKYNVRQMILLAKQADVPLVLVNPVSNLKNCPPFKCEFQNGLSQPQQDQLIACWKAANDCGWNEADRKMQLWKEAVRIDHQHADLLYSVGKTCESLQLYPEAKNWLTKAKEEDVCPLRILEPMHVSLLELAQEFHVPLVDIRSLIEQRTPDGIPGSEWLVDHVHPSIKGHQLIADTLYEKLVTLQLLPQPADWQSNRDQLRLAHLNSLPEEYFLRGALRSRRLEGWSRGRSQKIPPTSTQSFMQ
ncbi:SGNH/GDSL hydrolase family protein [Gimesia algae]|uniref:GDSL-like Lipase/Acylhydrolase n=1 Tax=Gimesia algae TaxID=2527971 RepID=A0A517V6A6_9PLAN|nr:SGNH/GDSL hydrolase family protein [Gimesia algae]QDT88538.1 GDSL-like Lipase/Acylhydrolase [Gimesia algae]